METDCQDFVNLWSLRHNSRSVVALIIAEIGEHACSFTSFFIQHISRSANFSTHLCAKQVSTLDVTDCWMGSMHSFLVTSLMADSAEASVE
uniref:RNase H type-1 domain-containing protein n=1 Tax=Triticum aestivum TaxID=4565 RepID=A0A3B6LUG4_WHEAT